MNSLDNILKFIKLTHDFQKIERAIYATGQDRMENDVEHSYQLAFSAWYIISTSKMNLDASKAVHYALIHDLVEVYAGDTDAFDKDQSVHDSKIDREHKALLRLKEEFPEFPELTNMIETYEKKADEESRFIYALDKIIAPINIYLDGGRTWKMKGVTLEAHIHNKKDKVKAHPQVEEYFNQLIEKFESEKETLFPDETV
jgi:putative hydrolases of HD superfamily